MSKIEDINFKWYNLGYSMGVNSRQKVEDMPERLQNFGDMGKKEDMDGRDVTSFVLGLIHGRRKIIQSLDKIKLKVKQGKKPLKKDMISLGISRREGVRGQEVELDVYIMNNRDENRGVSGYQLYITYNPGEVEYIGYEPTGGNFEVEEQEDKEQGILIIRGQRERAETGDMVVGRMRFRVKEDLPTSQGMVYINNNFGGGSGGGSELVTKINEEDYFITPVNCINGVIELEKEEREEDKEVIGRIPGDEVILGTDNELGFEFEATVGRPDGLGGGYSLPSINLNIYLDGKLVGQQKVPLKEGTHKYKGKVPIKLPRPEKGIIEYEIEIEDEEGFHYIFIKAGQWFILETKEDREDVDDEENRPLVGKVVYTFIGKIRDEVVVKIVEVGDKEIDIKVIEYIGKIIDKEVMEEVGVENIVIEDYIKWLVDIVSLVEEDGELEKIIEIIEQMGIIKGVERVEEVEVVRKEIEDIIKKVVEQQKVEEVVVEAKKKEDNIKVVDEVKIIIK